MSVLLMSVLFLSRESYSVSCAVRQCCCNHNPVSALGFS